MIKLTFGGKISKDDIWVNSLHVSAANEAQDETGTITTAMVAKLPALFNHVKTRYCDTNGLVSYATLEYIKVAAIDPVTGKYIGQPATYYPAAPVQGTATSWHVAPQDSVVASFQTTIRSGKASKGRIYLPAGFAETQPSTGLIADNQVAQVAAIVKGLIEDFNSELGSEGINAEVGVASAGQNIVFAQIGKVKVGNRMDTQRRRRNRLEESYTTVTIGS
jgi:hypothetical protein